MLAPAAFATSVPWRFQTRRWTCLSSQASREGGPSARSCHKVCLDADRGLLYTLGGYIDPVMRGDVPTMCDFYVYDVERRVWTCLSQDVAGDGGPGLIYDHQMCFHAERRTIYVFGGRCVPMCIGQGTCRRVKALSVHVPGGAVASGSPNAAAVQDNQRAVP